MTLVRGSSRTPHLAFVEALANTDEASAEWHALAAGHLAVRLFEVWAGSNVCGALALRAIDVRRVRQYVEAVAQTNPVRNCLMQLVDVMARTPSPMGSDEEENAGHDVGRILTAYGKLLQYDAKWALAEDVFRTLVAYGQCVNDDQRLLDSMLNVGFSLRMQGRYAEARLAYADLELAAVPRLNPHYQLQAQLGRARIEIEQGTLLRAASMLDALIEQARVADPILVGRALIDRARVADQLGDHRSAILLGYEALERSSEPADRDRILGNLALSFTQIGLWTQARDANLILSATAQEVGVRWLAQINLMELAYLEGEELLFEQHRRVLSQVELPPYHQAVYHETVGHGCLAFGRTGQARQAFGETLKIASTHGLNDLRQKAEAALKDVARARAIAESRRRSDVGEQPLEVATVAHAITEMRVSAGVR